MEAARMAWTVEHLRCWLECEPAQQTSRMVRRMEEDNSTAEEEKTVAANKPA
jgi:hypothetical protein